MLVDISQITVFWAFVKFIGGSWFYVSPWMFYDIVIVHKPFESLKFCHLMGKLVDIQFRCSKIVSCCWWAKVFHSYPYLYTSVTSQFNSPAQSNVKTSTSSVSWQMYFDFIIFRLLYEVNLSIVATPNCLALKWSNRSGVRNQSPKTMILLNLFAALFFFLLSRESKKIKFHVLNVMLKFSTANCCSSVLLLLDFILILDA